MGMIGNTPYQGLIGSGNLQDGAVTTSKVADSALTAAKLAAAAITDKLGYTPLNKAGDTPTGAINLFGVARNNDGLRVGANNASTAYGFRIGASGATDPFEIWREHSNGDSLVASLNYNGHFLLPNQPTLGISTMVGSLGNAFTAGTVHVNKGGFSYNSTTGVVTFPVTGTYLVSYGAFTNATNSNLTVTINVNGSANTYEAFACSNANTGIATATQTVIRNFSSGDSLKMYSGGGSVYPTGWGNFLSIILIG